MKELKIKLKQHTPLIHFQHDQEGATLRASEVKPKLDRFILTQLGNGDYEAGVKKARENKWLLGEHRALNYKMRIEASNVDVWDMRRDTGNKKKDGRPIFETMPVFFGNMHDRKDIYFVPKKMSFCSNPISLVLLCRKEDHELLIETKKYIYSFFMTHNFGTRQSKGFGSFFPVSNEDTMKINLPNAYAHFALNIEGFGDWACFYRLFDSIDLFYKTLKSGINQNGVYLKSLMYFYALDQQSYWDKRAIRHKFKHFKPNKETDKGEKKDNKNDGKNAGYEPKLYRDMLGLSSSQEWREYDDTITKEYVKRDNNDGGIDRFKSPLLIKPLFNKGVFDIYILPTTIPEIYKNAEFKITSRKCKESFRMSTPKYFDTNDFLAFFTDDGITNWILKELDKSSSVYNQRAKTIVSTLKSIYQNIKYFEY